MNGKVRALLENLCVSTIFLDGVVDFDEHQFYFAVLFDFEGLSEFFPLLFGEPVDSQVVSVELSDFININYYFNFTLFFALIFLLVLVNQCVVIYKMMVLICLLLFLVLFASLFFIARLFALYSHFLEFAAFHCHRHQFILAKAFK